MLNTKDTYWVLMLSMEKIVEILQDRKLSVVSKRTGLSYITVWRIARGCAGNVGHVTVCKLSDYLEAQA